MELGGFGKFRVRNVRPTRRRVGLSGETVTVTTKAERKVEFVPLGNAMQVRRRARRIKD